MTQVVATLNAFVWFLVQTATVGGIGFPFFAAGILTAGIVMWLTCPDQRTPDRGGFRELLWLPLVWIFVGLWGAWFWRAWETNAPPNPEWVLYPVKAAPIVMAALATYLIWRLRGARLLVATFAIVNLYFLLAMWLLAAMAISGDWL